MVTKDHVWKRLKSGKCVECLKKAKYMGYKSNCWWCIDCVLKTGMPIGSPETIKGKIRWLWKRATKRIIKVGYETWLFKG